MKAKKPKFIRTIGFAIALVAILLIIINTLVLTMLYYQTGGVSNSEDILYNDQSSFYALPAALVSTVLALAFLVSGIYITRYRNWARVLAQAVAVLLFINVWFQTVVLTGNYMFGNGEFTLWELIATVIRSVPFLVLAFYLSKENVKSHFV